MVTSACASMVTTACRKLFSRASLSSLRSVLKSSGLKPPTGTRSSKAGFCLPSQPSRQFSFSRCPSELGCVQSLLPLHSTVVAACLTSCLSTTSRRSRALSQAIRPSYVPLLIRRFSLSSTKKDPDLESALSRNKRWIVNSRLKNIILRCPNQVASIKFLQKKFKTLDLQGKALNWVKKYPCCFHVYFEDNEYYCRLTKPMMTLVEEEELVKDTQEPVFADRLAKLLMMSVNQRLNVVKLNELKRSFGFTDDYVIRILPKYFDVFRLVNYSGRKSSMEIELLSWKPELAVSAVEAAAKKSGSEPSFSCCLPSAWTKPLERFMEFNATPYISPYQDPGDLVEGSKESEKRSVGMVHELLSLTLWKKLSMVKLSHFKREFGLPEKLNAMLLKHPGIFYVSNKYQVHTVVLREGYNGSELIHKDPLLVVKDKFGELMQQGLYEYNHRRYLANLEKKREKGIASVKPVVRKKDMIHDGDDVDEQENHGDRPGGLFDPEERKRFYQILFSDTQ